MVERLRYWLIRNPKKNCMGCCLRCKYYNHCREEYFNGLKQEKGGKHGF